MKTLSAWLMIVVLATVTAGCSTGPGSSGENPKGDGSPITVDDDQDKSEGAIDFKADMAGGDADPSAPAQGGGPPPPPPGGGKGK